MYDYDGAHTAQSIVSHVNAVADGTWQPPADVVVKLTSASFDAFVASQSVTLVLFQMHPSKGEEGEGGGGGCATCDKLSEAFAKAARALQADNVTIGVVHVHGDDELQSGLAGRFDVAREDFPAYKVFRKGKFLMDVSRYIQGESASSITQEVKEQASPASVHRRAACSSLRAAACEQG